MEEQSKYANSLQYSLDQPTAHGEEFWHTFIAKDDVKEFINLLNGIISAGTKIVDTFGLIPSIAGVLGGIAAFKNIGRGKMYPLTNYCFNMPIVISVLSDMKEHL